MKVVIRADASLDMGSGHVMRCLTLADVLTAQGHEITFICRAHDGHLAAVIGQKGFAVQLLVKGQTNDFTKKYAHSDWLGVSEADDFAACQPFLTDLQPDWLIIDHYALGKDWEQRAKHLLPTLKILVIDDLADRAHDCEMLLDQNFGRNSQDYHSLVPKHCQCLVGSRYTLLRPEFAEWRHVSLTRRQKVATPQSILINLGGVDKDNVTLQVLEALQATMKTHQLAFTITVVMGKTAPHSASVQAFARQMKNCQVLINATNMAELMAQADIAIGASGSTTWERCCLGVPMVLLVLADNQRLIADALAAQKLVKVVENLSDLTQNLPALLAKLTTDYHKLSRQSATLVDGQGARRVANGIEFAQKFPQYRVRKATHADTQLIWQWRNHADVRQWMFGQAEIALADHERWFDRQLNHPSVHLMIFEWNFGNGNEPLGFVNFTQITIDRYQTLNPSKSNPNDKTASWGFYLSPTSPKGQGLGFALGILAIRELLNTTEIGKISAQVLEYNAASLALHRKLGFSETGTLKQHFGVGDQAFDVVTFALTSEDFLF